MILFVEGLTNEGKPCGPIVGSHAPSSYLEKLWLRLNYLCMGFELVTYHLLAQSSTSSPIMLLIKHKKRVIFKVSLICIWGRGAD